MAEVNLNAGWSAELILRLKPAPAELNLVAWRSAELNLKLVMRPTRVEQTWKPAELRSELMLKLAALMLRSAGLMLILEVAELKLGVW